MHLTSAQRTVLKTAIQAEPSLASALSAGNDTAVAEWLNSATTFVVWRTDVNPKELVDVFTWTEIDGLTAGRARIWEWMQRLPQIDFGKSTIRQGLADAFANATSTRTAAMSVIKRAANKAESLLASGTGTDALPGTLTATGTVSLYEVAQILRG